MHSSVVVLLFAASLLASCTSKPTVEVVFSGLKSGDLRGKTVAVGGLTSANSAIHPGQVMEVEILRLGEVETRRRLKRSAVLSLEQGWSLAGSPPRKVASSPPRHLGSSLTAGFIDKARASGIHYLIWIDLRGNEVAHQSSLWISRRTESSMCACSDVKDGDKTRSCRSGGSCRSGCCSSCSSTREIIEYNRSETARRRMGASYSVIDTATGRPQWCASAAYSRSSVHCNTSESGYPLAPAMPLPPDEVELMQRMTEAALGRLPR